jgi:hypothetical protein
MRNAAGMLGRATSGESCHRQIHCTPEQVNRAALADETRPELLQHAIGLDEHPPEAIDRIGIVRSMRIVLAKGNRVGDFVRRGDDLHWQIEPLQFLQRPLIKGGDRHRLQRESASTAIARPNHKTMGHQIEIELKRSLAVRNRRRRQPMRGNV